MGWERPTTKGHGITSGFLRWHFSHCTGKTDTFTTKVWSTKGYLSDSPTTKRKTLQEKQNFQRSSNLNDSLKDMAQYGFFTIYELPSSAKFRKIICFYRNFPNIVRRKVFLVTVGHRWVMLKISSLVKGWWILYWRIIKFYKGHWNIPKKAVPSFFLLVNEPMDGHKRNYLNLSTWRSYVHTESLTSVVITCIDTSNNITG